jgi:NAD(P)-dependent dehydrogenase (short-subunit alcohol dehydrogenase family)
MNIQGRVALVTGANRGLGLALTEALRTAGAAKIYAGARKPNGAAIEGVEVVKLDVSDPNSVAAAAARLRDVDILINNAGIFTGGPSLADGGLELARSAMETNFFAVWAMSRAFAPILKANGGGAIVNVLSVLSWLTLEGTTGYSASKAAAWALTNGLRKNSNRRARGSSPCMSRIWIRTWPRASPRQKLHLTKSPKRSSPRSGTTRTSF